MGVGLSGGRVGGLVPFCRVDLGAQLFRLGGALFCRGIVVL